MVLCRSRSPRDAVICSHHQGNQFEPLTRPRHRKSPWSVNRHSRCRRAREHKRNGLVELQLADVDAELSTRFDNVIRTNDHNSNVQLPELDFSPMQVVKWRPSALPLVHSPTTGLQSTPDTDWSRLEINFSPLPKNASYPPLPSPPVSLMTAAELGLLTPLTPKICLPELIHNSRATAFTPSDVPIVTPWTPEASVFDHTSQSPCLPMDVPEEDNTTSPFVAAKLPYLHGIDPFDLAASLSFDLETKKDEYLKSQPRSTRCTLYHQDDYDLEEHSLDSSQSLRSCEEGRTLGLVHAESGTTQAYALEVDWTQEPVVDWPYDILGDWNDEPALDWNGEPAADWTGQPIDDYSDDLVMIEHDAETYDWTFLSEGRALSDYVSTLSSAFSSMEHLLLPLRDSFMEEKSAYEVPIRELAENEVKMRRVSMSAWDSESDYLIPAFF
ncbi:hypothetical protein E4T51_08288 [Aureobasidium sp. EXF-12344]|nr:hypothetical protein E4T51_08288 [Aureobasidium sp. EXF-12344]